MRVAEGSSAVQNGSDAVATPQGYTVRAGDIVDDGEQIVELWRGGLALHGRPAKKLDWYYRHAVEGSPEVYVLMGAGEAAGVAAIGPRRMQLNREVLFGGMLVDFVALPAHRTFFPAMLLQREVHRRALETHDLLFGFPNSSAAPILRRVGYRCVGQLVRRARVLRSAGNLANFLPRWISIVVGGLADRVRLALVRFRRLSYAGIESSWLDGIDDRFDDLWERVNVDGILTGVRDRRFLKWRFEDCPFQTYRYFGVFESGKPALLAYAVCEATGTTLQVHDFLVASASPVARDCLWLDLITEATRLGYTSLSVVFMGSDVERSALARAGFIVRDERPVFAAWAAPAVQQGFADWYLTAADEDS